MRTEQKAAAVAMATVANQRGVVSQPRSVRRAVNAAYKAYKKSGRMLDAALAYAKHGYPVFPLTVNKTPVPARDKDDQGNPIPGTGSFYKATTDTVIINRWWKRREHLIGMPMGPASGIWALDIDTTEDHADDGIAAWKKLTKEHGEITTREHRSATDGLHLIFKWDQPIRCGSGTLPKGIDVKGMGGYIVVPPSKRKGRAYRVGRDIDEIEAPSWLTELILQGRQRFDVSYGGPITADKDVIADALKHIPNDNMSWDEWSVWGLAIYASTGGHGFALFDGLSRKSAKKYDQITTMERWEGIEASPPNRIGVNYIFRRARKLGWVQKVKPTYALQTAMGVEAARDRLRREIRSFLHHAKRPTAETNVFKLFAQWRDGDLPFAQALRVTPGLGKTRIAVEEISEWLPTVDDIGSVIYAVPTLDLGDSIAARFSACGVDAKVFRGRDADDPDNPSRPMCLNRHAVEMAMALHADVNRAACKFKNHRCRFFDRCSYQKQKQHTPQVWIVATDLLFHRQGAFGNPAAVVIDERYWNKGFFGIEKDERVPLKHFDNPHPPKARVAPFVHWRQAVADMLRRQPHDGGLERKCVTDTTVDIGQLIDWEWRTLPEVKLVPGLSETALMKFAIDNADDIKAYAHGRARIRLLQALREMLSDDQIKVSGRMILASEDDERVVLLRGVRPITKQFDRPTLLMDATLPEKPLLRVHHPLANFAADINVAVAPDAVKTRQWVYAPTSASKLLDNDNEKRREAVRRHILQRYIECGQQPTLVVAQMEMEHWLADKLPDEITCKHFNNIAGLDEYRDVRLLIAVGRTQPGPEAVETQAGALTGAQPVQCTAPEGGFAWFPQVPRGIRLRDGSGVGVLGDQHPDAMAEAVRLQICEGEVVQALGRGRAINRDASTLLDIDILNNVVLPGIVVDEVLNWRAPSLLIATAAEGVMLESPHDLTRLWPALWPNRSAADRTLKSGVPKLPGFTKVVYQLAGPKQKRRTGWFDRWLIADPQGWLEQRLGPLRILKQ